MRGARMNGYVGEFKSSFLSCEKDTETIIKKLFVDSRPYSDELKRLLLINTKDCLDDKTNPAYNKKIAETSVSDLSKEGYIRLTPKLTLEENEEVKSYLIISYDNFAPNEGNDYYRDCVIMIDILCHTDYWDMGNYRLRPLKIAGYIDGILNNTKLSGIGTLQFIGCSELVLNETLSGYCLMYAATHSADDKIPGEE
jgi:hypothetical protein